MRAIRLNILLMYLALLVSCAKDVPPPPCDDCHGPTSDESMESEERITRLSKQIEIMIANKSCDSDEDCKLIGVGYTPCGHPSAFFTYASQNVDEAVLEEKVRELRDLQQQGSINDTAGVCGFKGPPTPACSNENVMEEKRCILPGYSP